MGSFVMDYPAPGGGVRWPTRSLKATDKNYITKSTVMSLRGQFPFSEMCPDAISKFSARIRALIDTADVLIAPDPEDLNLIYGFICFEKGLYLGKDIPTLHYVWTRKAMRRNGIASTLINTAFGEDHGSLHYTHITRFLNNGNLRKKWQLTKYDPYLVEGALFRDAKQIDVKAIYWSQIPGQVGASKGARTTAH